MQKLNICSEEKCYELRVWGYKGFCDVTYPARVSCEHGRTTNFSMQLKSTLKITSFCIGVSLLASGCDAASFLMSGSSSPQTSSSATSSELVLPGRSETDYPTPDETPDNAALEEPTSTDGDVSDATSVLAAEPTPADDSVTNTAGSDSAEPTSLVAPAEPGNDGAASITPEPGAVDASPTSATPTGAQQTDAWREDYREDFNQSLEAINWERYGWHQQPVGDGGLGIRKQDNSFTRDDKLILQSKYEDGQWTSGGASTNGIFTASRGKWEVRAKFPDSEGLGYCFLLWPADKGWPPEIDFAEGSATNPEIAGTYHWDPDNKQEQRKFQNPDMGGWHTYGVIVEDNVIIFTLDGQETGRIEKEGITDKEMFLGLQSAPLDPHGVASQWETTVEGGVPNPNTPAISEVEIDWVAHYTHS